MLLWKSDIPKTVRWHLPHCRRTDMFVAYLLTRNIRYEEDLVDQLFNSSEKRLARDRNSKNQSGDPRGDGGHNRARVSHFMNNFRRLGFVDYDDSGLQVHSSLLNIVLHD